MRRKILAFAAAVALGSTMLTSGAMAFGHGHGGVGAGHFGGFARGGGFGHGFAGATAVMTDGVGVRASVSA